MFLYTVYTPFHQPCGIEDALPDYQQNCHRYMSCRLSYGRNRLSFLPHLLKKKIAREKYPKATITENV